MEQQQHGHVGNTHVHGEGEGGDHKIPLMRVISECQLDKQYQARSNDNMASIQDGVLDPGSRDEGRDFKDEEPRGHFSGPSRRYGGNVEEFKPLGEMTAAMPWRV